MRKFIALFMSMIVGSSIAMAQFNVDVQFWNNGKQQVLNNDFEIYFVYEYEDQSKVIYKPDVFMKNQIVLPSGIYSKDAYKDCSILFRYKGNVYYCATFRTKDIYDILRSLFICRRSLSTNSFFGRGNMANIWKI